MIEPKTCSYFKLTSPKTTPIIIERGVIVTLITSQLSRLLIKCPSRHYFLLNNLATSNFLLSAFEIRGGFVAL